MPIIAVAVAVVADVAAGSALVAGTLTTLEAIAAVGATLGAIGAVTGNKDLALAGGVIGGIGAIGSLASSAGLLPDFGTSAATGTAATTSATSAVGDGVTAGGVGGGDIIDSFGQVTNPADSLTAVASGSGSATDNFLGSLGGLGGATDATSATASVGGGLINSSGPLQSTTPLEGIAPAASVTGTAAFGLNGTFQPAGDASASTGIFGKIGDSLTTPVGVSGLVQAGGALIKGFFDPVTPAQIEGYQAQAARNRAEAALGTQQQANIAAPKAVVTSVPVTGAPAPLVPGAPMGMINAAAPQAPQQAPQVMA
jgi:hypothetical protein